MDSARQSASHLAKESYMQRLRSYKVTLEFYCGGLTQKDALDILLTCVKKAQDDIKSGEIKDVLDIFENITINRNYR